MIIIGQQICDMFVETISAASEKIKYCIYSLFRFKTKQKKNRDVNRPSTSLQDIINFSPSRDINNNLIIFFARNGMNRCIITKEVL